MGGKACSIMEHAGTGGGRGVGGGGEAAQEYLGRAVLVRPLLEGVACAAESAQWKLRLVIVIAHLAERSMGVVYT
jgi:hypothetical protein